MIALVSNCTGVCEMMAAIFLQNTTSIVLMQTLLRRTCTPRLTLSRLLVLYDELGASVLS